jgi:hypothetical protein
MKASIKWQNIAIEVTVIACAVLAANEIFNPYLAALIVAAVSICVTLWLIKRKNNQSEESPSSCHPTLDRTDK